MIKLIRFVALFSFVLLFSTIASAQSSTSSVTGTVTDAGGALIPGVAVTLTDTKTSKQVGTTTDDQGVYRFTQVSPGQGYKLKFSSAGFQTVEIKDVSLGVGITETHNAEVPAGQVNETVTITASGEATLNTTDASIGNVIDERRLRELPIQVRNSPAALIGLQPGVVGSNVGTTSSNRVGAVTGARADQGNITVDGIDANDQATGQFAATTGNSPVDSIQEFRAITTNPTAADGRSGGGQITLITKSGTNDFHGNLREYNRTAATAANSFFNNRSGVARPQLTRNQFGGSIVGPIKREKLFFFFDYEGRREARGISYLRLVPLNNFREGNLGYINNAGGISFLTAAQAAALDPQGIGPNQAFLSFLNSRYPQANDLTAGDGINTGGFRFNAPSKRTENTETARIDWHPTDKQKIFGKFSIARGTNTDTVNTVAVQFPDDPESGQIVQQDYTWVVGHNWVISPNIVNQATVGVARSGLLFPRPFDFRTVTLHQPHWVRSLVFK
ncbi:MAG TPA: carboxypeptidase-like regulatory domain-containing protein [Pyrinomonadaceae bacterium]|nr:carboxypeptidase-like regulatory domain-containing protein [Pyrinomonadaceae bacterium]